MSDTTSTDATAVLVAVQLPSVTDAEHAASLIELRQLVRTLGHEVVATLSQKRKALSKRTVIGRGKVVELAALTGGTGIVPSAAPAHKDKARAKRTEAEHDAELAADIGADPDDDELDDDSPADPTDEPTGDPAPVPRSADGDRLPGLVVVDHEITPSQARNLERATDAQVLDRTGVIVEIFHRHAKSRQAKIEVEVARLNYLAPRLRETGGGGERIGGRGAAESSVELDRRKIRDRIAELHAELAHIKRDDDERRAKRAGQQRVALVGYTNAGKSSLMCALTASAVAVNDQLFVTLDTTVRALQPETTPRILVSDTVGFIKKLPHDLVASFRTTLDEARDAGLLLYVADVADPTFRSQLEVTRAVMDEIGAAQIPSRLLLNKVDRLSVLARAEIAKEFPEALLVCAKAATDIAQLRQEIVTFFESSMVEDEILVPYARQQILSDIHACGRVLSEKYEEAGTRLQILARPAELTRLKILLAQKARHAGDPR